MLVDSASGLMRSCGMKSKSETTSFVQKFLADMNGMWQPRFFRAGNGGVFTNRSYVRADNGGVFTNRNYVGIRHEYTAPGKPQLNAVVEIAIWRAVKGGHAARREIQRLLPGVDFAKVPNVGVNGCRLWLKAVLWAADCFNRSVTKANIGWRSPREVLFARPP